MLEKVLVVREAIIKIELQQEKIKGQDLDMQHPVHGRGSVQLDILFTKYSTHFAESVLCTQFLFSFLDHVY